jgi:DNA-binding NarL/FixJ family response regulator
VNILFVSMHKDADVVLAALSTGAKGYVLKQDAPAELWRAIEAVLQGKQYVSRGVVANTDSYLSPTLVN